MLDALIGALCSWLRSVLDSDDDDQLQRQEMKGGILPSEHGWEHRPLGDGSVACASEIPTGSLISLMKATGHSVIETSNHASCLAIERLQSAPPAGMIALECVSQRVRVSEAVCLYPQA